MDSWRLRHAKAADAGRMLMINYPASLKVMLDDIDRYAPEYRRDLFDWYLEHCLNFLSDESADHMNGMWCRYEDIAVIRDWCRRHSYSQ
jgi:hypothetical protein